MSLLMDALKKAEEAKRQAGESLPNPTASTPTSEAPLPRTPPPGPALPDLSLHIDSVDADLAAASAEATLRPRTPTPPTPSSETRRREVAERTERADRLAAKNVFMAKKPPDSHRTLWVVIGLGILLALAIGIYFWWQLQSVSQPVSRSVSQPVSQSASQAISQSGSIANAPPLREAPAQPLVSVPATASATTPAPAPMPLAERVERPSPPPRATSDTTPFPGSEKEKAIENDRDSRSVRLSRTQPRLNKTLEQAYSALHNGQLDDAQHHYELVVRSDMKNTDALLGLATIAVLKGQTEQAQSYYQRVLDSDPNNASAQAGLINLKGQNDDGFAESRLKTAISSQPDSSALFFALGNTYARQARWSEAQQAYFRAYSLEPDNADFIFNLAVSLDHLHQNKLAAQYYQAALSVASASPRISFDRNQVKNRLLELAP